VLQCVATCCSVLQRVATCCSVLQCVAVCCSVLQRVAVCCSVLQCVAVIYIHNKSPFTSLRIFVSRMSDSSGGEINKYMYVYTYICKYILYIHTYPGQESFY